MNNDMEFKMAALEARVSALEAKAAPPPSAIASVAPDADLDGQYGDPLIRFDPKRWTGDSFVGLKMSQCPSDYLLTLAGFLDWAAGKADEKNEVTSSGKPVAPYRRKDAARARGWAARNQGKVMPPGAATPPPTGPGHLPF